MATINQKQSCENLNCRKEVNKLHNCVECGLDVCKDCLSSRGICKKCAKK